ncbi:MAG: dTDP-4-dehydrorhamnose reductase [Deltaproteobacteria bacterium]|nr:dTDP-4-dehydrorhamnose reductase [Deltaproteobacteria bacterium]
MRSARPLAVVLGGGGMLARELRPALERGDLEARLVAREQCDITDPEAVRACVEGARVVVNCAAFTQVDLAEKEREQAHAVNVGGAEIVAGAAVRSGAFLFHLSTDYVFDGKKGAPYDEHDPPAPLGVYARSKWAGEQLVRAACAKAWIVRTGELYGTGGPHFFDKIFARARSGHPVRVVSDQTGSPTWTRELARQLVVLAQAATGGVAPPGVYHATAQGAVSFFDAARFALEMAGIDAAVEPISTAELGSPTPRPSYSVLSHGALERLGLYCMRHWRDALAEWIATRLDPPSAAS